jgi:thiosulfate/3-mercaptopyruvate sulfurtransferase
VVDAGCHPAAADAEVRPWPAGRVVDADEVAAAIRDRTAVVLDARAAERYRGEVEPIDPVSGHIPGARSAPWIDDLDEEGRFLPVEDLRERFAALGLTDAAQAITHCGSGVTSCHAVFAMKLAGLGDARLYAGSWSDWASDPARPIAVGSDP